MYSNTEKAGGSSHDQERRKTTAAGSAHIKDWPKSKEVDSKQSIGVWQAKAGSGVSVLNKFDPNLKACRGSDKKENTGSKVINSNRHFGLEKELSTGRDMKLNGKSTSVKPKIRDSDSSKVDWPKSICFINNDDKFVAFGPGLPPGPHVRYCRYRWCSINGHKHPPTEEKSLFQRRKKLGNQISTPLSNSSLETSTQRQYRKSRKTVLEYSSSVDVEPICNYDEDTDLIDLLRRRDIAFTENFGKGKEETNSSGNSDVECEQTEMEVDDDQLRNYSPSVSTEVDNTDEHSCSFFPTSTLEAAAEDGQMSFHELDLVQDDLPSGSPLPCFINRDEEDRALINLSICDNGPDHVGDARDEHSHSECSPEDIEDKQPVMKESGLLNCGTPSVAEVDSDENGCSSLPTSVKLEEAEYGQDNFCEPSVYSTTIGDEDTISINLSILPDNHSCNTKSSLGNTANGDEHGHSDCFPEHLGDMEDKHATVKQEDGLLLNCRNPVVEEVDNDHEHDSSSLPTSMRLEEADDGQNISHEQSSWTEDLVQNEEPDGIPVPSTTIGDEDATFIFLLSLPDSHSCDNEPSLVGNARNADEHSHSDCFPEHIRDMEDTHIAVKLEEDDELLNCSTPVVAEVDSDREHGFSSLPTLMTTEDAENDQNNSHEQSSWTEDLGQGGEPNGIPVAFTTIGDEDRTLIFLFSHSCDSEPSPIGNTTDADGISHNDCSPEDIGDMEDTHIAVKLEDDDELLNCSTPVVAEVDSDREHDCNSLPTFMTLAAENGQNNSHEQSSWTEDLAQGGEPNGIPVPSITIGDEDRTLTILFSLPDSHSCDSEPSPIGNTTDADEISHNGCPPEDIGDMEDMHIAVNLEEEDRLLNCSTVAEKVNSDHEHGCSSFSASIRLEKAKDGQNNFCKPSVVTENLVQDEEPNGSPVYSTIIGDEDTILIDLLSLPDSCSCDNEPSLVGHDRNADEDNHSVCSPEHIRDIEDKYAALNQEEKDGLLNCSTPVIAKVGNVHEPGYNSLSILMRPEEEENDENISHEQSSWTEDLAQGGEPNGIPVLSITIRDEDMTLIYLLSLPDSYSFGNESSLIGNTTNTDEHSHSDCSPEHIKDIEDNHAAVKLEEVGQLRWGIPVVAEVENDGPDYRSFSNSILEDAEVIQNNSHEQSSWTEDNLVQVGEPNGTPVPSTTTGNEDTTLIYLLSHPDSHSCDNQPSLVGNARNADEHSHSDCFPEHIGDMEDTHIPMELEEEDGLLNCRAPVAEKVECDHEHGCSSLSTSIRLEEVEEGQNNSDEQSSWTENLMQGREPNGTPVPSTTIGGEDTLLIDLSSLRNSHICGADGPFPVGSNATNIDEHSHNDCSLEGMEDKHREAAEEEDGQNSHEDLGQPNDSHVTSATFGDGTDIPSNAGITAIMNADAEYNHSESSTVLDIRSIEYKSEVRRGSATNGLLLSCRSLPKLGVELQVHNGQAAKDENAYNQSHNLVRSYTEGAEILADYCRTAASNYQSGGDLIKRSGGWHRKRQSYSKIREEEAETVNLRHGITEERRLAEEYMMDFALVQAIRRLAGGGGKEMGVKLLVSAYETVTADKNQAPPTPHPFYVPRNNTCHLPQLLTV